MRPVTARGFRDVLPPEAAEREVVSSRMAAVFSSWGYELIETPVVEELAAVEAAAGRLEGTVFRLIDLDGRLLALRPDMTVPIARLVASRLEGDRAEHRFRYSADVFREHESLRGQSREFRQVGVELIGRGGAAADAEILSLLVRTLEATGLPEFTIAVGTVAVLDAILASASMPESWRQGILAAAHQRDFVELERLAREGVNPHVARAVVAVPRIRGQEDAIESARVATRGLGCESALDDLAETWALVGDAGPTGAVMIDFSVMRSFGYYTGFVAEAYAPGFGLPLGGGGRYDRVLASYGAPSPAAGFALGLERVMIALAEQGISIPVRGLDAVVGGEPAEVFAASGRLRSGGWRVVASSLDGVELVREADRLGAAEAITATSGRIVRLDRAGEPALPIEEPLPYAPTATWADSADSGLTASGGDGS